MLRRGTYVREPDGANLIYYSKFTTMNFPVIMLENWKACRADGTTRLNEWERVFNHSELIELGMLRPGEYLEVTDA